MKGKLRRCLKCDKPFWSKGAGNRLCAPYNKENEKESPPYSVYRVQEKGMNDERR